MTGNQRWRAAVWAAGVIMASGGVASAQVGREIEFVNSHRYAVRMPWVVTGVSGAGVKSAGGRAVQAVDGGVAVVADVGARGVWAARLSDEAVPAGEKSVTVAADGDGARVAYRGKDLGTLAWGVIVEKPTNTGDEGGTVSADLSKTRAVKLAFEKKGDGPLFAAWEGRGEAAGLELTVALDTYGDGFLDVRTTVVNRSAPRADVYAAVVTRWEQPGRPEREYGYNDEVAELKAGGRSRWRKGEGRQWFVQRGVDWVTCNWGAELSATILNDFAPSFTVHKEATAKLPARWVGGNGAQLQQEIVDDHGALVQVLELAHGNVKQYLSRLDPYVLPDASQPMRSTSRVIFGPGATSAERADRAFVAYTTWNGQDDVGGTRRVSVGAPAVKFGTSYFPYSTLGENFITRRLPGMSQDTYWPLAADVVKNLDAFKEQMRRDLRIVKSMGFESVRLHHLEMIYNREAGKGGDVTEGQRWAFLDFYFGELKHLGLKALLDVKLTPEETAELVKRYRPRVEGVEVDNEVLIFGIPDEDVENWKRVYAAVKAVAPEIPVHWTGHTNTGAFVRMEELGVPFDRVGEHAYADSLDAIPSTRGYALQVASFASKVNRPPVITEWNWRFLTRMTEEARAKVYGPIFENVLAAGAMPEVYQFQFQDSLAMNWLTLRGIRHYELLNLSRRPKAEAAEFRNLIERFSDPVGAVNRIRTGNMGPAWYTAEVGADGVARGTFYISGGEGTGGMKMKLTAEGTQGVEMTVEPKELEVELAGAAMEVNYVAKLPPDAKPGFYHAFLRIEEQGGARAVRYAWAELRKAGAPAIDRATKSAVVYGDGALDFDLDRPVAVVYGKAAAGDEVEGAWCVYQTLEAATGRRVRIYSEEDVPAGMSEAVIYVGTPKTLAAVKKAGMPGKRFVARDGNALVIGGSTARDAATAAADFALRYWKNAKDAACAVVPVVENKGLKGADPSALP